MLIYFFFFCKANSYMITPQKEEIRLSKLAESTKMYQKMIHMQQEFKIFNALTDNIMHLKEIKGTLKWRLVINVLECICI